jgi:uncharacterized glyoxalase superfamily protein PhnB
MSRTDGSAFIPCLRYCDPHAAIDGLCQTFGFAKNAVCESDQGGVEHAPLVYGNAMIMPGVVRHDDFDQHIAQPDEIGGRRNPMRLHDRGRLQGALRSGQGRGAVMVNEYSEKHYGGGGCSCRDPEGPSMVFRQLRPVPHRLEKARPACAGLAFHIRHKPRYWVQTLPCSG